MHIPIWNILISKCTSKFKGLFHEVSCERIIQINSANKTLRVRTSNVLGRQTSSQCLMSYSLGFVGPDEQQPASCPCFVIPEVTLGNPTFVRQKSGLLHWSVHSLVSTKPGQYTAQSVHSLVSHRLYTAGQAVTPAPSGFWTLCTSRDLVTTPTSSPTPATLLFSFDSQGSCLPHLCICYQLSIPSFSTHPPLTSPCRPKLEMGVL